MDQQRPRAREKKVVEGGKGVEKKEQGLGTGPVNNTGSYAGRNEQHSQQAAQGARPFGAPSQSARPAAGRPMSNQGTARPSTGRPFQGAGSPFQNVSGNARPSAGTGASGTGNAGRPAGAAGLGALFGAAMEQHQASNAAQRPAGSSQRPTSSAQRPGASAQRPASASRPASTSAQRPATSTRPPVTGGGARQNGTTGSGSASSANRATGGKSGGGKLILIVLALVLIFGGGKLTGLFGGGNEQSTSGGLDAIGSLFENSTGSTGTTSSSAYTGSQAASSSSSLGATGAGGLSDLLSSFLGSSSSSVYDFTPSASSASQSGDYFSSLLGGGSSSLSGLLGGSSSSGSSALSSSSSSSASTQQADTTVSSKARDKRVTLKGKGKDTVTIMVYMCGTDLESQNGMATSDLKEMTKADLGKNVNLLVYTGGCKRWRNSVVSSSVNQIYQIRDGGLYCLEKDMGNKAMTKPETLAEFLQYGKKNFSADRMVLIFWDHGGGSISGFGYDEKSGSHSSMTLAGINQALKSSGIVFDWIGYDACLMATVENGLMLSNYADYMIASEESEPGVGWYYTDWLTALGKNPSMPTVEIGKNIVDDFIRVCNQTCRGQATTLSVTDLAELEGTAPEALTAFAVDTSEKIQDDYAAVAKARNNTREFAQSARIDQIDLVDFANRVGTAEGKELAKALQGAVKYNRYSGGMSNAYGLSIYFPNRGTNKVNQAVSTFEAIGMEEEYTRCIQEFASMMVSGQATGGFGGYQYGGGSVSYGGGSGSIGSLLDLLGGGGYGQGGASYTASSSGDMMDILGGLFGGSSSSSSGLGFFSGRTLTAEKACDYISAHRVDLSRLKWDKKNHIHLDEDQWALIENVVMNVFVDDGKGYIDLGTDNLFEIDKNGDLVGAYDNTWLSIDKQPIAYYYMTTVDDGGDNYAVVGYAPAIMNGERVNLILIFDSERPYGYIAGAMKVYANGETDTQAKTMIQIGAGTTLQFICDYYTYDGQYQDTYPLGDPVTLGNEVEIANTDIGNHPVKVTWCLTDIYQQRLWTPVLH